MALINCSNCGKEISDKGDKCIHCGYSNKKSKRYFIIFSILFPILYLAPSYLATSFQVENIESLLPLLFWFMCFRNKIEFKYCSMVFLVLFLSLDLSMIPFGDVSTLINYEIIYYLLFSIIYLIGIIILYVLSFKKRKI